MNAPATRDACAALDAADPLRAFRGRFAMPDGVISPIVSVTNCTFSRFNAPAHTPLSRSIRFDPTGYFGTTCSSRSGRSANSMLMYSVSIIRAKSFIMLTAWPLGS